MSRSTDQTTLSVPVTSPSGAVEPHRQQLAAAETAGQIDDSVRVDRRRDRVQRHPRRLPDRLAGIRVIGADAVRRAGDDLSPAAVLDHQGRRPGRHLVAVAAPDLLARLLVEGDHEGVVLMVPDDEHPVAVKRRRASLAEAEPGPHVAEVAAPEFRPVEVEGVEALRTEEGDQHLAVRDRRPGSPGAVGMGASRDGASVRTVRFHTVDPFVAVQSVDLVAQDLIRRDAVTSAGRRRRIPDLLPGGNGGGQEQPVAPHDGRRQAETRHRLLPAHVLRLRPLDRRIAARRRSGPARAAPGRPAAFHVRTRGRCRRHDAGRQGQRGYQRQTCSKRSTPPRLMTGTATPPTGSRRWK